MSVRSDNMEGAIVLLLLAVLIASAYENGVKIYEIRKTRDKTNQDSIDDIETWSNGLYQNKPEVKKHAQELLERLERLAERSGDDDDDDYDIKPDDKPFIDETRSSSYILLPSKISHKKQRQNLKSALRDRVKGNVKIKLLSEK